jgi:hypothetical protein
MASGRDATSTKLYAGMLTRKVNWVLDLDIRGLVPDAPTLLAT